MNPNPDQPLTPVEDPSSASPPAAKGIRPTRGLSRLAGCSERQIEHINTWLDTAVPYRKIIDLCLSEFQIEIPLSTIQRYAKRTVLRDIIDALADSKEAAAELSQYAATGDANFSTNTLELLEQMAFDLTLAYNRDADADDLARLERLWSLIHKGKNTSIRERHASVQEQKVALRREELTLRTTSKNGWTTQAQSASLSTALASPSPTLFPRNAINSTHAHESDLNNPAEPAPESTHPISASSANSALIPHPTQNSGLGTQNFFPNHCANHASVVSLGGTNP